MSNGFQFLDIILFAMIAAFLILRLRSVLGRHKDSGEPNQSSDRETFSVDPTKKKISEKVISLPGNKNDDTELEKGTSSEAPLQSGLHDIKVSIDDFDSAEFLEGAQSAFEMIVKGFAEGDTELLQRLLNNEVYNNFLQAIRARESAKQTLENNLVRIISTEMIEAEKIDGFANVTVKIVSEQLNVTRNDDGDVVDGNSEHVSKVTDIWTFSRDVSSQDPNWMLISTRSLD